MNWIERIEAALSPAREVAIIDERDFTPLGGTHRPAAVLIPITDRDRKSVV